MAAVPKPSLHIERPLRRLLANGSFELVSRVRIRGTIHNLKFQVQGNAICDRVEPFVALALFPAMALGINIATEADCSPVFLANLNQIQEKFLAWDSSLRRAQILAPIKEPPSSERPRRAGAFFSGGVDSFHTLFRYFDQISDLVFVHGFDIPVREEEFYRQSAWQYETMSADLRKRLVRVWTNLRKFTDRYVPWYSAHGPALAAVALLLEPEVERMIIPGEYFPGDPAPPPRGSRPETDPMWCTEHLTIVHDGFDRTRLQKLGDLREQPVVRRLLRVCWERKTASYNCCICGKCLRNMAMLRALGVLESFSSFHLPFDPQRLAREPITMSHQPAMMGEILELLGTPSRDPALTEALQDFLAGRYQAGAAPG
jgi:hypothetical protein